MWKTPSSSGSNPIPKTDAPKPEIKESSEPASTPTRPQVSYSSSASPSSDGAISKGLIFKGEVTGKGSLYVDGQLEGSINLPTERVTIGLNGQVATNLTTNMHACITAQDIVVLGKVRGNVHASDRVDIRSEGSLVGDVTAARIIISDGAYFKGGIDLQKALPSGGAAAPEAIRLTTKVMETPAAATVKLSKTDN